MSLAILILKKAAAEKTSSRVGAALEAVGKGSKALVRGSSEAGKGLARGLGVDEALGAAAGVGTLAGGTYLAGRKGKRKVDEWKYTHNFQ